jgi:hypothetical protein
VAAVFGGLAVFASALLHNERWAVGSWLALAAGLLAEVASIVAFHAQLFKEDVVVT